MCGIAGTWNTSDEAAVPRMLDAMRHRGPNDDGLYRDATVALGMVRLSIIDVGHGGHQPMCGSTDRTWIAYNGEVYNFADERAILEAKGHAFASRSDTEVVLRMYEEYGDDFLLRLRGMFALAIYDKRRGPGRERLLLARDHLGIKPLLYARRGDRLVFASEMKALLASGLVEPTVDAVGLAELLAHGSVPQPHTMVQGVEMLLPAHRIVIEDGRFQRERYWSLGIGRVPSLGRGRYEDSVAEMASLLHDTTRRHLVSDVPIGAFLSGGIDSTLLVAMMARAAGRTVKTFSIGFHADGAALDETDLAAKTAAFLGCDHATLRVDGRDVYDRIDHIAASLDQPSVDGVNSYFASALAAQHVKVVLSGVGSDEIFAGYQWFASMVLWERHYRSPAAPPGSGYATFRNAYERLSGSGFGAAGAIKLLAPGRHAALARHVECECRDELSDDRLPHASALERTTAFCLRGYLNDRLLRDIDAMSMAHSLEVRVPYVDHVLVDAALSLPDDAKLGDPSLATVHEAQSYEATGAKRILFDVARTLLPKDIADRPKRGFTMPFDPWLRGPLLDVLEDTLSERSVRRRGLLNEHQVAAVRDAFLRGRLDRRFGWVKPWLLIMLELWCRSVLDRSAAPHVSKPLAEPRPRPTAAL
jgi:asparagine synthase (glutamine-hydrolysing)